MPRPKSPFPKIKVHFALPQETVARLRLVFHSENHANGLLHGEVSKFVNEAILEKFDRLTGGTVADGNAAPTGGQVH